MQADVKRHPKIALAIGLVGLLYLGLMLYLFLGDPIPQETRAATAFLLGLAALLVAGGELALRQEVNPVALVTGFLAVTAAFAVGIDDLGPSFSSSSVLQFGAILLFAFAPLLLLALLIRALRT